MKNITIEDANVIEKVRNYQNGDVIDLNTEDAEKVFEMNSGYMAETMINTLSTMYEWTKKEFVNYFTLEEVWCIMRAFVSTLYNPTSIRPKEMLIMNIEDCFIYEPHDHLSEVGIKTVLEKVKALTEFQCYVVLMLYFDFKNSHQEFVISYEEIKKAFLIGE